MEFGPLVKIPLVLLTTAGFHISNAPPNPKPSVKEGAIISSPWERLVRTATSVISAYMFFLWAAAFAESAAIVTTAFPSSPLSKTIGHYLLIQHTEGHVQLTISSVAALLLSLSGARIRSWCYQTLGKNFTFELSIQKEHELVTTGLYSIVRHPSYTGYVMNTVAVSLLHATRGSWVRESGILNLLMGKLVVGLLIFTTWAVCIALLRRMKEEDKELRKRFGSRWDAWAARVHHNVIPGLL
ncbi:hypothetical protein AX15_007042 [Amanita polypyramis BW_CC]|nr:hypothetical protein AX15_007042 [Amanita polypyramis BW_CC]